ncbi:hypothetical protein [Micromonospora sp. NPDC002717]|uniref:hypothetical protein n=1 Tax=Micromonospora sp. NPDC002717 TaxID=3154424 RepID=UPI00331858FF
MAAIAALVVTAGCGQGSDSPTPAATPTGMNAPKVTVERTGGFAGVHDTTIVEPDGGWTRTSQHGEQRSGRLTAEQQRELGRLVNDPRLPREARPTPGDSRCRDGFNYRVTIGAIVISYVDCGGHEPTATKAVVAFAATTTGG